MNTITCCPSCGTHYQVAKPDLQAAKGWLRCGQCGHVFDSTGLVLRWTSALVASEKPELTPRLMADDDLVADPADRLVLDDLLKKEDRLIDKPASTDLDSFEQALSSFKSSLPAAMPESVQSHPTESGTSSPWWMAYAVWALALGLLLQLGFVQRHAIVASWPESGPVIRHICQSFGCQVSPLRDVEGLVIDSSELTLTDDGHVLRWTIRNQTERPLGTTALEVSLMQGADQLVIRRVLWPEQIGAPEVLAPRQSWSGELALSVDAEKKFSDYRLLSFYP
jgi:predicted Zn finger-like uncharacterized protein